MNASQLSTHAARGYGRLNNCASLLASAFLLVIRVYWGLQFFITGKGKLSDLSKVTDFFASLHIPFPAANAALVGATECVGGLLLIAGLASRLTAIPLIFMLLVAYFTSETEALNPVFEDLSKLRHVTFHLEYYVTNLSAVLDHMDKVTGAAPFLFLFASVIVLVFGPGAYSLDAIIGKLYAKRSPAAAQTPPVQAQAEI